VTLLRRGGEARDATGTPAWLVLVESSSLAVLGVALLLSGWMNLIWLAVVLMIIGAVGGIRRRLWRRLSLTGSADDPATRPIRRFQRKNNGWAMPGKKRVTSRKRR
jgi:hypothetical protein